MARTRTRMKAKPRDGYRSGLEARLVPPLLEQGAAYEPVALRYPAPDRWYTPDVVFENGVTLELKGWFKPADRSKMLLVKAAHPALDIRMVLSAPHQRLSKASKTTLAGWCEKHGFPWCSEFIPVSWILEPVNPASKAVLEAGRKHKTKAAA